MKVCQTNFRDRCYQKLREVPGGYVTTYKLLAEVLGSGAYRSIGTAMAQNPDIPNTPCHRVVRSHGLVGDYALGIDQKVQILSEDGVAVVNGKVDLEIFAWKF